ncbi:hypothetical protein [Actinobacillus equuli]|uniref:Uncharacterized protein n=1 Tax=Actinobacillus equuli TaxID=718 RepID=A0AAX3FMN9_ACTEU|nr:hypothetical protein [Actinobacillus equuli]AIZ78678.1 hypothetical protein ACEE_02565 [Actinobacillus equuli subsp. equuli]WGE44937.1 hypothetical protein NYR65_02540 [Actinobacillus equuli subsp. equuli]WGE79421.1 hypothetical protein NYR83_00315 [Actinobacillus equuli subsp. equuli]VEE92824.1 Uncharacterised protein [Actinobacillus equuli]
MRNQTIKQPVQATTLTAEDIQAIKKARKQLWSAFAVIKIMSQSEHHEPMDYAVALEGVAKLMCDTLADFEEINL